MINLEKEKLNVRHITESIFLLLITLVDAQQEWQKREWQIAINTETVNSSPEIHQEH